MTLSSRDGLALGELSARSGIAPSALRCYGELGLIRAERTSGGRRRYRRAALRRLAFIRVAQTIGLSLEEVRECLADLPADHVPNAAEWDTVAASWQRRIDARIAALERLKSKLTGCVGCGCLSLTRCALHNPADTAAARGPGARFLLPSDEPPSA